MLGVPVRVHDMTGDDLGIAHVPSPVEPGDLLAIEYGDLLQIVDVVDTGRTYPIAALVRVKPVRPAIAARWTP